MYIFLWNVALAVYVLWEQVKKKPLSRSFAVFLYVLLSLLMVFRFGLGADTSSYVYAFEYVHSLTSFLERHVLRNPGFSVFLYLIKWLTGGRYPLAVLACNVFSMSLISWVVFKKSKDILFSLLLFIGVGYLEVYYTASFREMMAGTLFLFGYYMYLPEKKTGRYELFAILAVLFHEAAFPCLLLPLLFRFQSCFRKNPKRTLWIVGGVFVLAFVILNILFPYLYHTIGWTNPALHILVYFSRTSFSVLGLGMEIVFGIGMYILFHTAADRDEFMSFSYWTWMFSILIYLLFVRYSIVSRVCDLLQIIMLVMIPNLFAQMKTLRRKIVLLMSVLALNSFLLYSDLRYKIPLINKNYGTDYSLMTYPYFTVFNAEQVNIFRR